MSEPRPKPEAGEKNTYGLPRGEMLRRAMVRVYREQRDAILHYLKTGRKDQDGGIPHAWPDWNDLRLGALAISERMTPLLRLTWEAAADRFAPKVGLDPDSWSVVNPHTERMIEQAALAFCESTNNTTSLELDAALALTRDTLVEGVVRRGETVEQLTKRVMAIFDGASKSKARAIAQTETSRAVHAAQEQAAIASGAVTGWEWLASADACPRCIKIYHSAPFVRLGHAFAISGTNPHYSTVKFPPLHPFCNCSLNEVLDTDPQPAWHDTLHNPGPATPEEHDEVAPRQQELINSSSPGGGPRPPRPAAVPRPVPPPKGPRRGGGVPPIVPPRKPSRRSPDDPDWLPDLGPSKARVVGPSSRAGKLLLSRTTKSVFGKYRTARQLASMMGAPDDCRVVLTPHPGGAGIDYRVSGGKLAAFSGSFERRGDGRVIHAVGRLDVAGPYRGQPEHRVGTRIHGRMVFWGARLGLDGMELTAARGATDVGYLVWPIFGYDGPIIPIVRMGMPAEFSRHETIQQLLSSPGGPDYWHAHGRSIDVSFDLAPGSLNRRLWVDYWKTIPEAQRRPMEGDSEAKGDGKPARIPGELDPDGDYPNGLGLTNEEVVQGWRALLQTLAKPEVREMIEAKARAIRDARSRPNDA